MSKQTSKTEKAAQDEVLERKAAEGKATDKPDLKVNVIERMRELREEGLSKNEILATIMLKDKLLTAEEWSMQETYWKAADLAHRRGSGWRQETIKMFLESMDSEGNVDLDLVPTAEAWRGRMAAKALIETPKNQNHIFNMVKAAFLRKPLA